MTKVKQGVITLTDGWHMACTGVDLMLYKTANNHPEGREIDSINLNLKTHGRQISNMIVTSMLTEEQKKGALAGNAKDEKKIVSKKQKNTSAKAEK